MKLENRTIHVPLAGQGMWLSVLSRAVAHELGRGAYPLRLSIAEVRDRTALAEVTVLSLSDDEARRYGIDGAALLAPRRKEWQAGQFAGVNVVPTGVRCEFGGDARGARPANKPLASPAG